MPDELFRAAHSHNSAPNSDIVGHTRHFVLHFVAVGAKRVPPARSTLILGRVIKASKNLYMIEEEGVFSWEIRLRIKEKGM